MKKIFKLIVIVLLILLAVMSFYYLRGAHKKAKPATSPTLVTVSKVRRYTIPLQVQVIGQLIAPQTIMLSAKQAGVITGVDFKSGQQVKAGQLLLQIDDTAQKANVAQKYANYINLKTQFGRYQKLQKADAGGVSEDLISQKRSLMNAAKAELEAANKELADTKVVAPFAGIISIPQPVLTQLSIAGQQINESLPLTVGSYLQIGEPIAILSNPEKMLVQYQVPESYSAFLKLGQPITLSASGYAHKTFHGIVTYISPLVIENSQTFNVRADVNNEDTSLHSGMNVMVTQTLDPNRKILAVPGIALIPSLTGYEVYTIEHGKVKAVPVKIDQRYKTFVAIKSGLKAGDEIIVSGIEKIHPGMAVKVKSS